MIDDSIVRGTTLKQSILRILDRLNPMQIIIASSIANTLSRCYGIDMAKLGDFIAFCRHYVTQRKWARAHYR